MAAVQQLPIDLHSSKLLGKLIFETGFFAINDFKFGISLYRGFAIDCLLLFITLVSIV